MTSRVDFRDACVNSILSSHWVSCHRDTASDGTVWVMWMHRIICFLFRVLIHSSWQSLLYIILSSPVALSIVSMPVNFQMRISSSCGSQNSKLITYCLITSPPEVGFSNWTCPQQGSGVEPSSRLPLLEKWHWLTVDNADDPKVILGFSLSITPHHHHHHLHQSLSEILVGSTFKIDAESRHFFPFSTTNLF